MDLLFNFVPIGGLSLELVNCSKAVGRDCLKYLSVLKKEKPSSAELRAGADQLQKAINSLNSGANVSITAHTDSLTGLTD